MRLPPKQLAFNCARPCATYAHSTCKYTVRRRVPAAVRSTVTRGLVNQLSIQTKKEAWCQPCVLENP